jgi:serine/threonine protein kinase
MIGAAIASCRASGVTRVGNQLHRRRLMLAGTLASHYRVESQLGAGGMGVVYEATDTRLGRRVALKVLHDDSLSDAGMLARLEREARVLGALNHSNIAAFGLSSSCGIKGVTTTSYDVSRDGQRFLMIKDRDSKLYATKVRVVLNWVEELTKVVADANGKP